MTLEEQIQADVKTAMKSGDKFAVATLRSLNAQLKDERIKLRTKRDMNDEDMVRVLLSAAKKRQEAIELYQKGNRPELVEKEQQELKIVRRYLPEQLSEDKINKVIDEVIASVQAGGIKDLGKVMGTAMGRLKGKADGKLVQQLVRDRLSALDS